MTPMTISQLPTMREGMTSQGPRKWRSIRPGASTSHDALITVPEAKSRRPTPRSSKPTNSEKEKATRPAATITAQRRQGPTSQRERPVAITAAGAIR